MDKMKLIFLTLFFSTSIISLLTQKTEKTINKRFLRLQKDRKLFPMDNNQIDSVIKHTSLDDISDGMSTDQIMDSVTNQNKMEELLTLIGDFHKKMKQVDNELNDGVSRLNSFIGLTRKFK